MPQRIDLRAAADPGDALHVAVEALASGAAVVLPTEVGYLRVYAGNAETIDDGPAVFVFTGPGPAADFFPSLGADGLRTLHRVWPAPLIVSTELVPPESEGDAGRPEPVGGGFSELLSPDRLRRVATDGRVDLWSPSHPIPREVARYLPPPLVALVPSSNDVGPGLGAGSAAFPDAETAAVVLDDGPIEPRARLSIARRFEDGWRVAREGAVTAAEFSQCLAASVLFVCTGNTCRSPLAEGIFRAKLAARLGVAVDRLAEAGVSIGSAGIAAQYGMPASRESRALSDKHGYGLESHASQGLTGELLDRADHVFVMTRRHRDAILDARPDLARRVELLSRSGGDIADPIGGGPEEYEFCRRQIEREVDAIVDTWGNQYGTERQQ